MEFDAKIQSGSKKDPIEMAAALEGGRLGGAGEKEESERRQKDIETKDEG